MQVITREQAKAKGEKFFYTGTECVAGHKSERYVTSGQCLACKRREGFDLDYTYAGVPGGHPWLPTDVESKIICEMARNGVTETLIARCLCVDRETLAMRCADLLATAQAEANNTVANSLYQMATEGPWQQRLPAAIFWLKVRAGWREVEYIELLRPPSEMSDDELDQAIALAEGAAKSRRKGGRVVNFAAFRKGKAKSA
jgi:hypothetical protein